MADWQCTELLDDIEDEDEDDVEDEDEVGAGGRLGRERAGRPAVHRSSRARKPDRLLPQSPVSSKYLSFNNSIVRIIKSPHQDICQDRQQQSSCLFLIHRYTSQ